VQSALVKPVEFPYRPGGQAIGIAHPSGQKSPAGHSALQGVGLEVLALYVPATHDVQTAAPAPLYFPASQLLALGVKDPSGQKNLLNI
jgi:hypothetical protein